METKNLLLNNDLSRLIRKKKKKKKKKTICICETKGANQLRRICEADQRPCLRHTESTIRLLSKSKISSL